MLREKITSLLTLVIMVIAISGCGRNHQDPAVISFFYWTEASENHLQMERCLQEYTERTGKVIELLPTPREYYQQKLFILLGAQSAPDVFLLTFDQLAILKEKRALLALQNYYQKSGLSLPDPNNYPELYDAQGGVYGLIIDGQIYGIFSQVTEPDESWELLKFLSAKL